MKYLIMLLALMLMTFQTKSQTISKGTTKITINQAGDTLLVMNLSDAKFILGDLLDKEISDSIINDYQSKDSISRGIIVIQKSTISLLEQKSSNQAIEASNLNAIIINNKMEIGLLNKTITADVKEIKKQKLLKTLSLVGGVILTVGVLLLKP